MTGINEIVSENISLEREGISSSSSISNLLLTDRLGLEGKEREYRGNSLSLSLEKSFGISYKKKRTIRELSIISKYDEIVDEMSEQKCFTNSYITALFERHQNDKTIKMILDILVKRRVLYIYVFNGKAKGTFGLPVYYTHEATESDLQDTIRLYQTQDELRYTQELKRKKDPPKTPEETMEYLNEIKRLAAEERKVQAAEKCCQYTTSILSGTGLIHHSCGKGTVRQIGRGAV